jgi:RNA polymerase sigma factor (sigma-70 family)
MNKYAPAELLALASAGDRKAQSEIIRLNEGLITRVINQFPAHRCYDEDDLMQVGRLGVLRAAQKFDPGKGVQFSTYAATWIRAKITMAMIEQRGSGMIRKNGASTGYWALMRGESVAEVAAKTQRTEAQTQALANAVGCLSLDWETESGLSILACITVDCDVEEDVEAEMQEKRAKLRLWRAMRQMTQREREVLFARHLRCGVTRRETLDSIGKRWGLSRERVRQIETKAMEKVRRFAA